jgi:hypothetical protein
MQVQTKTGSRSIVVLSGLTLMFSVSGCALSPIPDTRTPTDYARNLEPKCRDIANDPNMQALNPSSVDSVDAAYAFVMGGPNGRSARLRGARIQMKPIAGTSKESLTRALECHEANVVLGRATAVADDPYVLADRWLDIEVTSEGDSFVALVTTDDFNDAREVLARAKRFANSVGAK